MPHFLLPLSAALATVASGWLTMLAGAGVLRPGRVTSLNCPCYRLPPGHLAGLPAGPGSHGTPSPGCQRHPRWQLAPRPQSRPEGRGPWQALVLESGLGTSLTLSLGPSSLCLSQPAARCLCPLCSGLYQALGLPPCRSLTMLGCKRLQPTHSQKKCNS